MRPFQGSLRTITLSAAIALAAASTPLLAQKVSTDYDHGANFSQYHSYSFGKIQASDPLFEQRIRDEVSRDLNARGWQMVPSGGDITVNAIGGMKSKQEYSTFYDGLGPGFGWRRGWGGGGFGDSYTTVDQIPVGTLVVDLYATGSHQLLFRGTATDELSNKPDKNTAKLDKGIDKILGKLPKQS